MAAALAHVSFTPADSEPFRSPQGQCQPKCRADAAHRRGSGREQPRPDRIDGRIDDDDRGRGADDRVRERG